MSSKVSLKEEQEELCTSRDGEQLVLEQETEAFTLSPTYDRNDHSQDQTLLLDRVQTQNVSEREPLSSISFEWLQSESDRGHPSVKQ